MNIPESLKIQFTEAKVNYMVSQNATPSRQHLGDEK